ncbi:MAG: leucyl aminopeptidase, partial [Chloroflexota bacterium]
AIVGLGKKDEFTVDRARQAAGSVARRAQQLKLDRIAVVAFSERSTLTPADAGQAVVEGATLATYRYLRFKTKEENGPQELAELLILEREAARIPQIEEGTRKGELLARATILARDLVNGPGNLVTPTYLAEQARQMAEQRGIEIEVLGPDELRARKMGALLGVSQGSAQPPRMIKMRYRGASDASKTLAIVGKGITFDSGGISIKPSANMEQMKDDMSGAAAVIGAMQAIADLKVPANVIGVIPATENMPSGSAYKPGDVLTAINGKTIEVVNTDAEGRVALADALAYAVQAGADAIVDLATLTGACVIALGNWASGLVSNNDQLAEALEQAGRRTGDRLWRLPSWDEYAEQNKSDIADVKNSGGRPAGTITGGLFLTPFIDDKPWAHIDIAGTAWLEKDRPYAPKGAAGVGVRLLADFAEEWAKSPAI